MSSSTSTVPAIVLLSTVSAFSEPSRVVPQVQPDPAASVVLPLASIPFSDQSFRSPLPSIRIRVPGAPARPIVIHPLPLAPVDAPAVRRLFADDFQEAEELEEEEEANEHHFNNPILVYPVPRRVYAPAPNDQQEDAADQDYELDEQDDGLPIDFTSDEKIPDSPASPQTADDSPVASVARSQSLPVSSVANQTPTDPVLPLSAPVQRPVVTVRETRRPRGRPRGSRNAVGRLAAVSGMLPTRLATLTFSRKLRRRN